MYTITPNVRGKHISECETAMMMMMLMTTVTTAMMLMIMLTIKKCDMTLILPSASPISIQCGNIRNKINVWQPVGEQAQPSKAKLNHRQDNGRRRYYFPFDKELSFFFFLFHFY